MKFLKLTHIGVVGVCGVLFDTVGDDIFPNIRKTVLLCCVCDSESSSSFLRDRKSVV